MITKLKRIILTAAAVLSLGVPALVPAIVHAQSTNPDQAIKCGVNSGVEFDVSGNTCQVDSNGGGSLQSLIVTVINVFSVIVGVIAVIMIIIGGLKYITSGGESSNVSGAKNTIIYAIIGLVVVALAQFIVRFVLTQTNTFGG
jgi:hypothetical protein